MGAATTAASLGFPEYLIKALGRWSSKAYKAAYGAIDIGVEKDGRNSLTESFSLPFFFFSLFPGMASPSLEERPNGQNQRKTNCSRKGPKGTMKKNGKNGRVDKQAKGLIQNKDAKMAKCKEEGQRPDTK